MATKKTVTQAAAPTVEDVTDPIAPVADPIVTTDDWSVNADPVAAELARNARKPNISWLEDATVTVDGTTLALFTVGDRIVIERYAHFLQGSPWLDTQTYLVKNIDDDTGNLSLWNPDLNQFAAGNFVTGTARGDVYKLAPKKGTIGKRKRGRPRKNLAPTKAQENGTAVKKGRGRPPGAKNRPKDVIKAEREALRNDRAAKAASKKKNKKRISK